MPAQNQGTVSANIPQKPPTPPGENHKPKKLLLILAIIAVLVIIIIGLLIGSKYLNFFGGKSAVSQTVAKVGSELISKDDVQKLTGECVISEEDAVNNLVDEKVLSKWAIDERVNISEEEASDEAVRIGGLNPKDCKKTLAKVNLLRNRLKDNLVKFREGKYISINFGLYANPKPITAPPGVKSEEDRLNKLKEERDYADILTDSIYKEINDKKISFEEAMEKVRNDPKVGNKSTYETSFQSQAFTADDYNNKTGLLSDDSIIERINALSEGQMSEPFVHKINVAFCASEPGCEPEIIDSRWIILKVERIGKGLQGTAESLLADVRKQYKAEIF